MILRHRNFWVLNIGGMVLSLAAMPAFAQIVPDTAASRVSPKRAPQGLSREHHAEQKSPLISLPEQAFSSDGGGTLTINTARLTVDGGIVQAKQNLNWITNMADRKTSHPEFPMPLRPGQTPHQAFMEQQRWLSGKIIGDPQPTYDYSVAQLKAMHIVGVYSNCSITASKTDRFGAVVFDTAQKCDRSHAQLPKSATGEH